ncbi:MAG TPA: exo-alpha-sialidase [candidate division WOR-3 bacterium]|uniref:Exo-alpha-sialidase n=1 Tax=candidate division WOR-3 bacterium TaxID=2052148 RepID=A0A7V0T456_UNCW3|nr:exo-alpha-sialidase [candidate division WOR-3 bacterium]
MERPGLIGLVLAGIAGAQVLPGVIDTVGGTTFDNQNSGPSLRMAWRDPAFGLHIAWTFSAQPQGSNWPDRTMRYNFFDAGTGAWNWLDPDYMNSGMNSQMRRTGYGTLDVDPDGAAVIATHYNVGGMPPNFAPTAVRDLAPGAGVFEECIGAPGLTGWFLPVVGAGGDGGIHLLLIKFQAEDNLFYSRSDPWCTWRAPEAWHQGSAFGHNLTASRVSGRVLATWMSGANAELTLNYRFSDDGGASWNAPVVLEPPTAWGGDTTAVCARGAGVVFDANDDWLLATTVLPVVGDSAYQNPAQLWLFSSAAMTWFPVHRAEAAVLAGRFGSHAAICDRPSIGINPGTGRLYVAWEEFHPDNAEPSTDMLRADIWLAWSDDGALSWSDPVALTEPDESSKRLPHLAADCSGDSLAVIWVQDLIAGFNVDEIGPASYNPVCVWQGRAVGIADESRPAVHRPDWRPPVVVRAILRLPPGEPALLLDASGRKIMNLRPGENDIGHLPPGVYFVRRHRDSRAVRLTKLPWEKRG